MRMVFCLTAMLVSANAYAETFDVNVTGPEINAAAGLLTVDDLAVGEVGITSAQFCIKDGKLFMPSATVLMEKRFEYGANHRIRKEPGGAVRIDIFFGEKATDKDLSAHIAKLLANANNSVQCKSLLLTDSKLTEVDSINGMTNAKQALGL